MTSLASMHHHSSAAMAAQHHHLTASTGGGGCIDEDNIQWLNRDSCLAICQQRRHKLLEDESDLKEVRDQLMRSQKTTLINGLCTLSRDIKKMTVAEFNQKFGCDVVDMIKKQIAAVAIDDNNGNHHYYEGGDDDASSSGKKRNRVVGMQQQQQRLQQQQQFPSLKTPAVTRFGGLPPMTIARTARKGERLVVQ